jgi:SOS-response transcriptional repressor LexA
MGQPNVDAAHLGRLRDHYAEHGALPSYAHMGEVLGFRAKNAAVKLAQRLSAAGFLRAAPGGKLAPTRRFFELPLFDTPVRAGLAESIDGETAAELVTVESYLIDSPSTTVLIRVKGDSMKDAGIFDGDLAVVDCSIPATAGAFVIANVDGDYTLKELRYMGKFPVLIPHNTDFEPIRPVGLLEVYGVVRGIVRKFKGGPTGNARHTKLGGTKV